MITLFGSSGSGSAVIEVALKWCDVDYQVKRAAQWEPDSALEELSKFNPLKQIPTLVFDDGTAMSETAAILIELALRYPSSGLLPTEGRERAKALRGLVYIAANCYAAVSVADYPERWNAGATDAINDQVRRAARAQLHRYWEVFSDLFVESASASYLIADEPCALDIFAAVVSKWSGTRQHLETSRPGFLQVLQRIEAHPNVAPVFDQHWGVA